MGSLVYLVALACFTKAITAQSTSCPITETQISTSDGSTYGVCKDYNFSEGEIWSGIVEDVQECADKCSESSECVRATYSLDGSYCLTQKASGDPRYFENDEYYALRRVPPPTQGSILSSCPKAETSFSLYGVDGFTCSDTSYHGRTLAQLGSVTSLSDCAQKCATIANCQNAAYDRAAQICYLKDASATQQRTYNSGFDSIRVTSSVADGTALSVACAGTVKRTTSRSGVTYDICYNSDWPSTQYWSKPCRTTARCSNLCDKSFICGFATFEKGSRLCRAYPDTPSRTFKRGSNTLKFVSGPQQSD